MNEMRKPVTAVSPATLARLIAVVGEKNAITDKDKQTPLSGRISRSVDGPHAGGFKAGLDGGSV